MKQFKICIALFSLTTFFVSCDKEITMLPENANLNSKTSEIVKVSARPDIDISEGSLFALAPWESSDNISKYIYNPMTNDIYLNEYCTKSTQTSNNYGIDFNKEDGLVYLLADGNNGRSLYTLNMQTGIVTFVDEIVSANGNTKPQDLTFGNDGTLYFVFQSGEVNTYDFSTNTMNAFTTVSQSGGVGLTFDEDDNRLIYATSDEPVELYEIDAEDGDVNYLFSFYTPGCGTAQGIEYLGYNKFISSSTFGCDIIYSIDLDSEEVNTVLSPTGSYSSIKDLMFLNAENFGNIDNDCDGVEDANDPYPYSNLNPTIYIDNTDFDIDNEFVKPGTTMMDQIDDLIELMNEQYNGDNYNYLHKKFVSELSKITYYWYKARVITSKERTAISRVAWSANVPSQEF